MSGSDAPIHDLAALDDRTLACYLDISDIVIAVDRKDPAREVLLWGRERLTFLIHMQDPAQLRIARFSLELQPESPEVRRLRTAVIAAKGSCEDR